MKSLERLHLKVLQDAGLLCGTTTVRDAETLSHRWEGEGDSFLTITLPLFAKALETGLSSGKWPKSTIAPLFKHNRGLPSFMRGFLLRIFRDDGTILDEPDANCVWAVRQVCYLTHKVERDTSPTRRKRALDTYIETDRELGKWFEDHDDDLPWNDFQAVSSELFGNMFDALERDVANYALIPAHGPGAVAEKLRHKARWKFPYWTERLEEVFPRWRYAFNAHYQWSHAHVSFEDEIPVRVITVPKTQATPRIIAIEPTVMQYAQQGLWRRISEEVENSVLSNLIGFADQSRNQRLALQGSTDGSIATLDLSEASDRVHLRVVENLLHRWPHLREYVLACRSYRANVEGEVIRLHKFASMGSSLTFPIEAIVFSTLTIMGIRRSGHRAAPSDFGRSISIYGDDICCPQGSVSDVIQYLELFGFKVNHRKSFWTGQFRESCGKDYFNGTDVSVVRLREDPPGSRQDAARIRRFTEFRNRCYRAGLWNTVRHVDTLLRSVVLIHPRYILESHDVPAQTVSFDTVLPTPWRAYWDSQYHVWREKHLSIRAESTSYEVDGEGGLLKWFQEAELRSVVEPAFASQERPRSFHTKTRGIEYRDLYSMGLRACGAAL